ncbi:MAG: NAD-dependent epimerase/dehydratase family protein [Saprospiraceae bacterium]
MKKVLLTGANGLLGSHVAQQLTHAGYLVRAMVRKGKGTPLLKALSCEIFEGDLTNPADVWQAVKDCDFVVHAAARTSPYPMDINAFRDINIEATTHLISACLQQRVERFVYVSTANCFTNGTKEHPGTEDSEFMPWLKHSAYAYSKYLAQQQVLSAVREKGFPAIVVCPTFMIGSHDYKPSSGQLLLHLLRNRLVVYPPGGKCFVDATAAAVAIKNALTKGEIGQCYLLAEENLSYREFYKLAKKISNRVVFLLPIPRFLLTFLGHLGSFLEKKWGIVNALSVPNTRMLCTFNYFSGQKAKAVLAMPSVAIEASIKESYHWFKTINLA